MKKLLAFLISIILSISLVGCAVTTTTTTESNAISTTVQSTTTTQEPLDVWALKYYVDEFDSPTNDWYVTNTSYFVGAFSNSATTDSLLYVKMLFDNENIGFFLYEYGDYQVKNSYSNRNEYTIIMKDASGTKHEMWGFINSGSDRLFISPVYYQTVLNAFNTNGTISFYLYDKDRTVETYRFDVETSNFSDIMP